MRSRLLVGLCAAAAACSRTPAGAPPPAEFLLASEDSTFWVATAGSEVHVRGVPITLARYGGRFYELYTADDDFSYDNALLVGERLYRRDLVTGDSAAVFTDTAVVRIAADYARNHPDDRPLGPDEDGDPNPETTATAEVDVLGVFGPYVSYEYHVDVDLPGQLPWHSTRRGVIDLRNGADVRVADLFGNAAAQTVESGGRERFSAMRDSVLAARLSMQGEDLRAADAFLRLQFDPRSFTLSSDDRKPSVGFDIPGRGEGRAGDGITLDGVALDPTSWWKEIAPDYSVSNDAGDDLWDHSRYRVLARYDTSGEVAKISLADSTRREWPVVNAAGPLQRIEWLDDPRVTAADRTALLKAFNSAASYDETSRVAVRQSPIALRSVRYARHKGCQGKPARDLRAHDARACEQHGARVRRGGAVDDGQDGGHFGVSSQPRERGHRVDRSRGLPRTHTSRRLGHHEGQRQLRRAHFDGSGRAR
jgi:hypothetical protein